MREANGGTVTGQPHLAVIPAGSLRHFAVLYSGSAAKDALAALYAFEQQVAHTVFATSHDVAHVQLQWWRGEVDRLVAGHAAHPVTRSLQALPAQADRALLHETLVAADIDLAQLTLANAAELEAYCYRASGSLQTLAAHACAGSRPLSEREQKFAVELGACVRQAEFIRDARYDLSRGRSRVPLDRLAAAGIDASTLRADSADDRFFNLLHRWRDDVRARMSTLPGLLNVTERTVQRHGLILAALHLQLLRRLDHGDGRHPDHVNDREGVPHEVPAWQRLWTAWRTAVRYR
jgi:phytoene/squalene synthetase